MRRIIWDLMVLFLIGVMCVMQNGCSVGMALHGKKEPQLDDLKVGMSIDEAHFIMREYTPAITYNEEGDRVEEYDVEIGNAPSGGRALGHLAMDVLTFGAWEVVGTPVEGLTSKSVKLVIIYKNDKITSIKAGKEEGGL